jgi:hypothetical protein
MVATKTNIANAAMALLGQTRFADVDTDSSERAKWVRELWAGSLDEALRAHPWNFAAARKTLGENLLLQSQVFGTTWIATSVTVTANQDYGPDGTLTADLLNDASGAVAGTVAQAITVPDNSNIYTFTVYLKRGTAAVTRLRLAYSGGTGTALNVDITWAATPTVSAGSLEDAGGGWWRFTLSLANNALGNTTLTATIYPASATAASTGTVYAWGAQINRTDSAVGYVSTTVAASRMIFPTHGYAYGLPLPADFLRMWDVNDGDIDYKIEGDYLLTDSASADVRYTKAVTDTTAFDPLFCRALSIQIAKDLCLPITGNLNLMGMLEVAWRRALGVARTTDSQEDGQDRRVIAPWILARLGGG